MGGSREDPPGPSPPGVGRLSVSVGSSSSLGSSADPWRHPHPSTATGTPPDETVRPHGPARMTDDWIDSHRSFPRIWRRKGKGGRKKRRIPSESQLLFRDEIDKPVESLLGLDSHGDPSLPPSGRGVCPHVGIVSRLCDNGIWMVNPVRQGLVGLSFRECHRTWSVVAEESKGSGIMTPFMTAVVLMILMVAGAWGSIILKGLFQSRRLEDGQEDPRLEELREENQQLEVRLERLEEEIGFLRELHRPKAPDQLPGSNQE